MSIYQRIVSEIVRKRGTESNTARNRSAFCFLLRVSKNNETTDGTRNPNASEPIPSERTGNT